MKFNVIFLLDTRLGKEDEEEFEKMWGGKVFFNSLSSNRRGLAGLLTPITDIGWENILPGNYSRLTLKPKSSLS